jgi:class 3 adenylate cyclase
LNSTELPSGTVTFLFTDIEGSTQLLAQLGDGSMSHAPIGKMRILLQQIIPGT